MAPYTPMKDRRVLLYLSMLAVFVIWLGILVYMVFFLQEHLDDINPMMTLLAGLGIGSITQFFILVLTLGWQFFYRKSGLSTQAPKKPEDAGG